MKNAIYAFLVVFVIIVAAALVRHQTRPVAETVPPVAPSSAEAQPPRPDPIRILAWNIESGGNDPEVIALQLMQFGSVDL